MDKYGALEEGAAASISFLLRETSCVFYSSLQQGEGTGEVCPLAAAVSAPPPAAVTVLPMEGASVVSQALPTQPW
ncbi:Hypothetical predicted protein [Podarcis lilfordi]|uniref:Uncharacterized protein n=1 Tax=Podarcis lilfordi TaxID=74358 RepID=A0AA35L7U4_9SAUR|nr:Hypothetical predicted protein [Podarcis lilfordi]